MVPTSLFFTLLIIAWTLLVLWSVRAGVRRGRMGPDEEQYWDGIFWLTFVQVTAIGMVSVIALITPIVWTNGMQMRDVRWIAMFCFVIGLGMGCSSGVAA